MSSSLRRLITERRSWTQLDIRKAPPSFRSKLGRLVVAADDVNRRSNRESERVKMDHRSMYGSRPGYARRPRPQYTMKLNKPNSAFRHLRDVDREVNRDMRRLGW